ncbi:MAG: hypothetical protein UHM85_04465 [Acutalibacteraceae bacterium]|nr:hypothetical protein [Acutalibacteraceae bacterium]
MKKIIAIILTVIMLMAVSVPGMSALAADKVVTVYLEGYGSHLYDETGKKVFPTDYDIMGNLTAVLEDLLKDLGMGMISGNYDAYCDRLYNALAPAFAEMKLDNNGECTDENGNPYNARGLDPTTSYNRANTSISGFCYRFDYDWRLSVEYNAALLEQYVLNVMNRENAQKVNLVGRCLGGNIVSAFLENASEETLSRVNKAVLYIPSTLGIDFISALFSGKIVLHPDAVDNYVKYSLAGNDILGEGEDDSLIEALITIVEFVNEIYVLGFGMDVVEGIVQAVKENALARILRDSYGSFPSFWAMVCAEDVEDAIALVYNTPELQQEYAGMIEKIRSYCENVQINAKKTTAECVQKGIDVMIVSKYNFANFPLSDNALLQSDSVASTTASSYGAYTSNFGETLSKSYLDSMSEADKKYLSKDNMIDASTCLLPEKTWFVKNLYHDIFPPCVDGLIDTFLKSENMTIGTYGEYPQFMKYDEPTDTLSPVEGLDDGDIIERGTVEKKLSVFMKFLTLIMNFFRKLFGGELDLGNLFG